MVVTLDYYYGNEAEQFSFYRIPKVLFTDERFRGISPESKILYGLMLDRMGLSVKNGWLDKQDRVFIYFTLEDAAEMLSCGHEKAVKLFAELEKTAGLIERKRQGLGKPAVIYVKNFSSVQPLVAPPTRENTEAQTSEKPKSGLFVFPQPPKPEVLTSEKPKSEIPNIRSQDIRKTDANNTEYINTDLSDTEPSSSAQTERAGWEDEEEVKRTIEYEYYEEEMPDKLPLIDKLTGILLSLRRENAPQHRQLLKTVDSCAVMEFLDELPRLDLSEVRNITAYLRRVLLEFLSKRQVQLTQLEMTLSGRWSQCPA